MRIFSNSLSLKTAPVYLVGPGAHNRILAPDQGNLGTWESAVPLDVTALQQYDG